MNMEKFWMTALRINLPVTVAAFLVFYLVQPVLNNQEFVKDHPILVFAICILIINFAIVILISQKKRTPIDAVTDNTINDNEIEGNLGIHGTVIKNNKITKSKIGHDLIVGSKKDE